MKGYRTIRDKTEYLSYVSQGQTSHLETKQSKPERAM
jgi:hypothetical protein